MKRILFTFLMLLPLITFGQDSLFSKMYYNSINNVVGKIACPSYDGGVMIAGKLGSHDETVMRTDSLGNVVWSRHFFTPDWFSHSFVSATATADSCYIVAYDADGDPEPIPYCLKLDDDGGVVWTRAIETGAWFTFIGIVEQTSDSITMVGGHTDEGIFLIALDRNGEIVWDFLSQTGRDISAIKQHADGTYYAAGYDDEFNPMLLHFSADGQFLSGWSYEDYIASGLQLLDDGILLLCSEAFEDNHVIKVNYTGSVMWSKRYNQSYCGNSTLPRLERLSDNSFAFLGSLFGSAGVSAWEIDSDGEIISKQNLYNDAFELLPSGNGGAFFVANGTADEHLGIGIMRVDEALNGNLCAVNDVGTYWNYPSPSTSSITMIDSGPITVSSATVGTTNLNYVTLDGCLEELESIDEKYARKIDVFPTISNGQVTIKQSESTAFTFKVFDLNGKEVYSKAFETSDEQLDLSFLKSAVYIYSAEFESSVSFGRFVIAR